MLNLASRIPHFSEKHHGEVETRLANQFLKGFQGVFRRLSGQNSGKYPENPPRLDACQAARVMDSPPMQLIRSGLTLHVGLVEPH